MQDILGLKGINNMGNTCYINSACQCLGSCPSFVRFIVEHGVNIDTSDSIIRNLFEIFELMRKDSQIGGPAIIPNGLLKSIYSKMNKSINIFEQNDVNEFLSILLDKINSEVCKPFNVPQGPYGSTLIDDLKRKLDENWKINNKNDYSPLKDIFYGQLISQIICGHCHKIHHNYEVFMNIMLPIHAETLAENMDTFFGEETVNADNNDWCCDQCKQKEKSSKVTKIWRGPKILVVSLKRFAANLRKKNDPISIPRLLDMSTYTIGRTHTTYILKGVACHSGSFQFGHYCAIVNINDSWFIIDDDVVRPLDTMDRLANGYVFFYESIEPVPPTGPKSSLSSS